LKVAEYLNPRCAWVDSTHKVTQTGGLLAGKRGGTMDGRCEYILEKNGG